jgi:hypothetical protein
MTSIKPSAPGHGVQRVDIAHQAVSSSRPLVSISYRQNTLAGGVHFRMASPERVSWRQKNKEKKISMVIKNVDKRNARGRQLLSLIAGLVLALTIGASKANAQIVGDLVVKVPFQFHAGDSRLPAGEYRIRVVDDSGLSLMEISSMDGSTAALFQVQETDAQTTPTKSELIFNKYGDQYFLAKLFDEGESIGSEVLKSRYEQRVSRNAVLQAQEHVPTGHGNATKESAVR